MSYDAWNWRFFGLMWLTENRPVQEWFDLLPEDAKEEARDTFGYLQHLPIACWKKPQFDPLKGEEVNEVRFETATHFFRVYGYYGPNALGRQAYTLLLGHDKQTRNDKAGKREATKRKRSIERGDARVHQFEFYRASPRQDRKGPEGTR
jgi:hypothetical protein